MKLRPLTRIVVEDFKQENQELVNKLAAALNPFLEQMNQILTKNVDFENLNQQIVTFTTTVNASGKPSGFDTISHSLKTKPQGIIVVSASNQTDSTYPTSTPFVSYTFDGTDYSKIKINAILGLPADKKFTISCLIIG